MEGLIKDIRYAVRSFSRQPGFTAIAVGLLTLGIGVNTAIFSLVDAVLLKPLPVKNAEHLVAIDSFADRGEQRNFSYQIFEQLRAKTGNVLAGVFAATDGPSRMEMTTAESSKQTQLVEVHLVSGEYFQVLGVNPIAGRLLTVTDDQTGGSAVAVLSYDCWQDKFGGDNSVIGKRVTLKQQAFEIIGITPRGFFGEAVGRQPDVWAPLAMEPLLNPFETYLKDQNVGWLRIMGRRQPQASEQQAQAALTLSLDQIKSDPAAPGKSARRIARIEVTSGRQGLAELRNRFRSPLRVLMAAVLFVLLIACANVTNLMLARATTRQKEVAVRMAIGAGRFRLIRQFLTESLLLALFGGAFGLLVAWWSSRLLLVVVSDGSGPLPIDVEPNTRIFLFTFAVSLVAAMLAGLAPALIVTRQNVNSTLKANTQVRPRLWISRPLIVVQIAVSVLLLTGAGLFIRTLDRLRTLDLGFASDHLLQAQIDPQRSGYKPDQLPDLYRRLQESLSSTPGVVSVSSSSTGFRSGNSRTCCIVVDGYTPQPSEDREIRTVRAAPGYFRTIGVPLLSGRDFESRDLNTKPGESPKVAIINQTMSRHYFGDASPLGRRFGWGDSAAAAELDIEIVGVVSDTNFGDLRDTARRLIYFPTRGGSLLTLRVVQSPAALAATVRQKIQSVDQNLEISHIETIPQLVDSALSQERMLAKLSGFFSLLALLLAAIGLYGLMSYEVARRTPELGIRMALGARGPDVLKLVLKSSLGFVVAGVAVGLLAAFALTRLIESLLFQVTPTDAATFLTVSLTLMVVALVACLIPARRATKVDPLVALRYE
jgi:predicted permease